MDSMNWLEFTFDPPANCDHPDIFERDSAADLPSSPSGTRVDESESDRESLFSSSEEEAEPERTTYLRPSKTPRHTASQPPITPPFTTHPFITPSFTTHPFTTSPFTTHPSTRTPPPAAPPSLSSHDDDLTPAQKKQLKNKLSAQAFRARRKLLTQTLESELRKQRQENAVLIDRISELESERPKMPVKIKSAPDEEAGFVWVRVPRSIRTPSSDLVRVPRSIRTPPSDLVRAPRSIKTPPSDLAWTDQKMQAAITQRRETLDQAIKLLLATPLAPSPAFAYPSQYQPRHSIQQMIPYYPYPQPYVTTGFGYQHASGYQINRQQPALKRRASTRTRAASSTLTLLQPTTSTIDTNQQNQQMVEMEQLKNQKKISESVELKKRPLQMCVIEPVPVATRMHTRREVNAY